MDGPMVADDGVVVSRRIFSDEAIYRDELERVFRKSWLFLATDDMVPRPGDYVTTYMGEEPVIVVRDKGGAVRAFLNTCPHRGNRLCMFDAGNAPTFTCSYHGWSFGTDGKLVGVPFFDEAYRSGLDRERLGLVEVPSVERFCGLLFGNWEPRPEPLAEYLGDLGWYLRTLFLAEGFGGVEVVPGTQRYRMPGNWKIISDNFAGDHYHTFATHASGIKVGVAGGLDRESRDNRYGYFEISAKPFHGLGGVYTNTVQYENDLRAARALGEEVETWVRDRYARLQSSLAGVAAKPYGFGHATCFPNLSFLWGSSALAPRGLYLWHPRGPLATEAWQWCLVERDAPRVVKARAAQRFSRIQAAAGVFAVDDSENFERMVENTVTPLNRGLTFHYGMSADEEGRWPGSEAWHTNGLPGSVGPRFTEMNQRSFYRHWHELMHA